MPEIERLTITMPAELAAVVKQAVATGDYASTSEVVRAALRDWKLKRALQIEELAALKTDIDKGLAALLLFGFISYGRLGVGQLPDVDFPVVSVNITWEGAAPDVMETDVVDIIEDSLPRNLSDKRSNQDQGASGKPAGGRDRVSSRADRPREYLPEWCHLEHETV